MPPQHPSRSKLSWASLPASGTGELTPQQSRSFVLKMWVESTAKESAQPIWRGHITRVAERTTYYFKNLEEVVEYLRRHLTEMLSEGPDPPDA